MKCERCNKREATTTATIEVIQHSPHRPFADIVDKDIPACERCAGTIANKYIRANRRETLEGLLAIERDYGARR